MNTSRGTDSIQSNHVSYLDHANHKGESLSASVVLESLFDSTLHRLLSNEVFEDKHDQLKRAINVSIEYEKDSSFNDRKLNAIRISLNVFQMSICRIRSCPVFY